MSEIPAVPHVASLLRIKSACKRLNELFAPATLNYELVAEYARIIEAEATSLVRWAEKK